jgi:hypothetical protein
MLEKNTFQHGTQLGKMREKCQSGKMQNCEAGE